METWKTRRKGKGRSQQGLADAIGVSRPMISHVEARLSNMSKGLAVKAARVLGGTPDRIAAAQERTKVARKMVREADKVDVERFAKKGLNKSSTEHLTGVIDGLSKVADDDGLPDDLRDIARKSAESMLFPLGVSVPAEKATEARRERDAFGRRSKRR